MAKDKIDKTTLDRWFTSSESARKNHDWKWFVHDLWVSGNHFAKYDRNTQQIITTDRDEGKPQIVINKTYTTLRAVRNYSLRNDPRAEVTPVNLSEENVDEARKLNKFLVSLSDKLEFKMKLKSSVWHALKYSVGFWQVLWNEDADEGGEIEVNIIDPYDLYIDPSARSLDEARYVVLAVRRSLYDLQNDDKYDSKEVEKIKSDKQLSASSLKSRLIKHERGESTGNSKDEGTVIVKEFWYKEYDKEGEPVVKLKTMAGDRVIREEDTDLFELPFFRLQSDIEPLSMYGQGWVKNLIPANRLLDRLESQVAEYNDLMNRGKWVSDRGAGVRVINNENGQIIEKKKGYDVNHVPIAPIRNAIFQQIENVNRYIEDIGGAHDASLGRIPTGAKSGKALEALQVGDANNLSEVTENIEMFLERVYEYILRLASQKYQFARNIIVLEGGRKQREFLKVIGESAVEGEPPEDTTVIPEKNMLNVKITPGVAHTPQAKREALKELFAMGAIDEETLLQGYNIGNIAEILDRVEDRNVKQGAQDIAMQSVAAKETAPPPEEPEAVPGAQQAIAAIRSIVQGVNPVEPEQVSPEYIEYIDSFLQSPEGQQMNPETRQQVQAFRDAVVQAAAV